MARTPERPAAGESRPESPCTDNCKIDSGTGWCAGCYRTIEEIIAWPRADVEGKREILARLPARRGKAQSLK